MPQEYVVDLAAYGDRAVRAVGSIPCICRLEYTVDGGRTWRDTGTAPSSPSNATTKVVLQSDIAYATQLGNPAGGGDGPAPLYVSTDGAKTWSVRSTPCPGHQLTGDIAATAGHSVAILCLDRSTTPYSATVLISTDGGHTFRAGSQPVGVTPGQLGGLALAGRAASAVATESGVLLSTDGGQHWRQTLSCGPSWLGFESATEAHAVCGGNTVWRSNDGGQTWQKFSFPG